jgi:hypothetical protein
MKYLFLLVSFVLALSGCESVRMDADVMSDTSIPEPSLSDQQLEEDKGLDVMVEELDRELVDLDVETDFAVLDTAELQ